MATTWAQKDEDFDTLWISIHNNTYWLNENGSLYDDYEELYEVPTGIVVLLSICYGSISVLAVVGNSLVMWIVATSRRMQSVTDCFIANLAVADILIGLFAIPFQFQAALLQRWNLPYFMCAFCPFVRVLCVNVSVFTLTAIAVDRHRAVLKPLSARPSKLRAKVTITGIWVLAGALAAPMATALRVVMVPESTIGGRLHTKPFCRNENLSENSMLTYQALLGFLQYLTPLSILSCVYARMVLRLWGSKAPGNAEDSRDANLTKNKKKVIKMLVIVVALFAICWLPLQMYNVLQYTYPKINEYRYINIIWFSCDWLAMSNSCCNPFIYGIYNEKFKREFQRKCPFKSRNRSSSPITVSLDMNKMHSTRTSIRYEWRRPASGICAAMTSFYKGIPIRETSNVPVENKDRHYARRKGSPQRVTLDEQPGVSKTTNGSTELYVFPSGRHKHTTDYAAEELCL